MKLIESLKKSSIFLITIKQNSLYKKGVVKKEVCYALDNKKLSE